MNKKYNLYDIFIFLIILGGILYIGIRAYLLSIVHDEALTYNLHVVLPLSDILTFRGWIPANNHLLNTLLIKLSIRIFGLHEFTVRLPALLGGILYLIGTYRILKLFLHRWHLILGMVLMTFNPFLLETLSLGRGYAIGLGFSIFGMHYIFIRINELDKNSNYNIIMSVIMMSAAVLAHLTFLYIYLTAIFILILLEIFSIIISQEGRQSKNGIKIVIKRTALFSLPILSSMVFLTIIYYKPIIIMQAMEQFDMQANKGFWLDTVTSLINTSLYGQRYRLDIVFLGKALIVISLLSGLLVILWELLQKGIMCMIKDYLTWTFFILLICTTSVILQHLLFKTPYIHERYAIFYIPIFSLFLLMLWKYTLSHHEYAFKATTMFICLLTVALALHFVKSANFQYSFIYREDAYTEDVLNMIVERTKGYNLPPNSINIGISWTFEPGINFYIVKNNLFWIRPVDRRGPYNIFDFYYVMEGDYRKLAQYNVIKVIKKYDIIKDPDKPSYSYFGMLNMDALNLKRR